jgi:hypothetical protein
MALELSGVVADLPVQGYFAKAPQGLPGPAVKIRAVAWPQGASLAEIRAAHASPEIIDFPMTVFSEAESQAARPRGRPPGSRNKKF